MRPRSSFLAAIVASALIAAGCFHGDGADDSEVPAKPRAAAKCTLDSPSGAACRRAWAEKVARAAGYRIVGRTQTAWVAAGGGHSFYIWATPRAELTASEGYREAARVEGAVIYTDDVRHAWQVQRVMVWITAGPREDAKAPPPDELAALVRGSESVPLR